MRKTIMLLAALLLLVPVALQAMTEAERSAYLEWMKTSLPEVPEFNEWQARTGELPPDFDALPSVNGLPDLLTFNDGTPVGPDAASWQKRRAEILALLEKYMLGTFPPKPEIGKVEVTSETSGPGYYSRNVTLYFGPENKGSVRVSITVPTGMPGSKYPVLLASSIPGWGNSLLRRGYISAGFAGSDFMDDAANLQELYPGYDFATLPRRAWVARLVLDYLATVPEVNMEQVAIFGYSRDGKMATIAGAIDERFAAVLAGSTGVGGVVPWRFSGERGGGEGIESTTRMFPGWFVPRLRFFSGREDRLPVDANFFLGLLAPRAILMEWGLNDEVANGWAMEQAYHAAAPVYERFGALDRMSLMHVPGFHGSNDQDAMVDFLDIQFGRTSRKWNYDFLYTWSFDAWKKDSGQSIDMSKYPAHDAKESIAKNLKAWEAKEPQVKEAIADMLGAEPVIQQAAARGGMGGMMGGMMMGGFGGFGGGRGAGRPGPIELAKNGTANPGQLAPDVPTWVVARSSAEFGWVAPAKDNVASKRISFGTNSITGDLYYPANVPEGTKLPVVIWLHGYNFPLGYMWVYRRDPHPVLAFAEAGYAVLAYNQTGHGSRYNEYAPFYSRYPHWSRLGMMVNELKSAVDALQNDALIDTAQISVLGFTQGGTVGLYGAALDSRIKNVISVCGFTPMRSDKADNNTMGLKRYGEVYGLAPRIAMFEGQEERLPYDYDDVMAMVAPRGVLIVQNTMDRDADVKAVGQAVERARSIFKMKKAEDQITLQSPVDYARFNTAEQQAVIDWLKAHTN